MNKKIFLILGISIIVLLGVGTIIYFCLIALKPKATDKTVESNQSAESSIPEIPSIDNTNPLENKPDLNPVSKTNPYKNIKINPFE